MLHFSFSTCMILGQVKPPDTWWYGAESPIYYRVWHKIYYWKQTVAIHCCIVNSDLLLQFNKRNNFISFNL